MGVCLRCLRMFDGCLTGPSSSVCGMWDETVVCVTFLFSVVFCRSHFSSAARTSAGHPSVRIRPIDPYYGAERAQIKTGLGWSWPWKTLSEISISPTPDRDEKQAAAMAA